MKPNEINLIDRKALRQLRELHPELSQLELVQILLGELEECLSETRQEVHKDVPDAANQHPDRKKVKRGKPNTYPFPNEASKRQSMAEIARLCREYYNSDSGRVLLNGRAYPLSDFLLAYYYVKVEQGAAMSVLRFSNRQYYAFLVNECGLSGLPCERTFCHHLNKVVRTGRDFHQLTPSLLARNPVAGQMSPNEYVEWKTLVMDIADALTQ